MKLLMENWRRYVLEEQEVDEANEKIRKSIKEFMSNKPLLLKEYGGGFYLSDEEWDDEEEEEAEEVLDDLEDEAEDAAEEEIEDTIGDSGDANGDVPDRSHASSGYQMGTEIGSKVGGIAALVGGIALQMAKDFGGFLGKTVLKALKIWTRKGRRGDSVTDFWCRQHRHGGTARSKGYNESRRQREGSAKTSPGKSRRIYEFPKASGRQYL